MKKLLLALALFLAPSLAWAQCSGVFPANTICGNNTGSPAVPTAVTFGGAVSGPGSTTVGHFATWNNTLGTLLADFNLFGSNNTFTGSNTFSTGTDTFSGTANFSGTFQVAGATKTFPSGAATLAGLGTNQTFTGNNTFSTGTDNFTGTFQIGGTTLTLPVSIANGGTGAAAYTAPTVQRFTSSSGTYTTPTSPGPKYIRVTMLGGGGGGAAAATNNGANGVDSSFGSWTAVHGNGGTAEAGAGGNGGTGGTNSTGTLIARFDGQNGFSGSGTATGVGIGFGGISVFGGGGVGTSGAGGAAKANTGSGGAGGISGNEAGGGGAAEYVQFLVSSPAATYSYAVGGGGNGGAAGGAAGGNGAAGIIIVEEYYW